MKDSCMLPDVDPGLAQDRDSLESVTNGRDVNGNGQNRRGNVLWNNQYALLADDSDGNGRKWMKRAGQRIVEQSVRVTHR